MFCITEFEEEDSITKHTSYSCVDWFKSNHTSNYPSSTTDFLLVIDCMNFTNSAILEKVCMFWFTFDFLLQIHSVENKFNVTIFGKTH